MLPTQAFVGTQKPSWDDECQIDMLSGIVTELRTLLQSGSLMSADLVGFILTKLSGTTGME